MVLLQALTSLAPGDTRPFREAFERATDAGGYVFEVIVGAPFEASGLRVTFQPAGPPQELARALGRSDHPWGTPSWIGLRQAWAGGVRTKAYHRLARLDERFPVPDRLALRLVPVMASLDGGETEVYLRVRDEVAWSRLAEPAARLLDGSPPEVEPRPRPAADGFCVSFAWCGGELAAVTLYADSRCLPPDDELREAWSRTLGGGDRRAYEVALAAVRSTSRPAGCWHGMLAWQLRRDGVWRRAASLRPAPPSRAPERSAWR